VSGVEATRRNAREQTLREHEETTADNLAAIRAVREQCESYGQEMSRHARGIEEASAGENPKNYFVQRRLGARRELQLFVGQVVLGQAEMLDEVERELSSRSEEERDRLRREKASVSWD
jgi:hypothetical protein